MSQVLWVPPGSPHPRTFIACAILMAEERLRCHLSLFLNSVKVLCPLHPPGSAGRDHKHHSCVTSPVLTPDFRIDIWGRHDLRWRPSRRQGFLLCGATSRPQLTYHPSRPPPCPPRPEKHLVSLPSIQAPRGPPWGRGRDGLFHFGRCRN